MKPRFTSIISVFVATTLVLIVMSVTSHRAEAHEVPTDVVVQTIVKPTADQLDLLVRVPLEAMRDVNFPQTGMGLRSFTLACPERSSGDTGASNQ